MIKRIITVFTLFIVFCTCFAQESATDTLVFPDDIVYNGPFEEEQFNRYFNLHEEDYLNLFLASSATIDESNAQQYRQNFYEFLSNLKIKTPAVHKPKKRIKTIYKATHNHYFTKYELKTSFEDIFRNGGFNCVTASALYGIILQKSNIPFDVRETPVHVYLVSYPGAEEIKIEATDPLAGYMTFDLRTKKQYVDYMRDNKFISENEYGRNTIDELFNKYYFSDQKISLKELLGIQYLNNAVYLFNDHKIKEGYRELEKAYIFYPCEKTAFLMLTALTEILGKETYDELTDVDYLVKISRFNNESITPEAIRNEFAKITHTHLINRSDIEYYEKIYRHLENNIRKKEFIDEIAFIYHYERGRFLFNRSRIKEALPFFEEAFRINPDNADVQAAFVQSLAGSMRVMDTHTATDLAEEYAGRYEQLTVNPVFSNLLTLLYLGSAMEKFDRHDIAGGDKYLLKFEEMNKRFPEGDIPYELLGKAYSSGGMYFFRKGYYKKAREYIKRGLVISPDNPILLYCLTSFE